MSARLALGCIGLALAVAVVQAQAPPATGVQWVRVPAGTFQMGCISADARCDGDEHPRHAVTISRPFDLMPTEVTLGMYRAAIKEVDEQPPWSTSPDQPVVIVTWDEALAFCRAVGGRLPTEAEWERAARGGREGTVYSWGDQAPVDRAGAVNGAAFESDSARAVKSFAPNAYGLYDMVGTVWEWVADAYGGYQAGAVTDPERPAPPPGEGAPFRVVRGGAYGDDPANLRLSNRNPNRVRNVNVNVGFRCARDAP